MDYGWCEVTGINYFAYGGFYIFLADVFVATAFFERAIKFFANMPKLMGDAAHP